MEGVKADEKWHRLRSYNEAVKNAGYFFGYVTSIEPENDRLMVIG